MMCRFSGNDRNDDVGFCMPIYNFHVTKIELLVWRSWILTICSLTLSCERQKISIRCGTAALLYYCPRTVSWGNIGNLNMCGSKRIWCNFIGAGNLKSKIFFLQSVIIENFPEMTSTEQTTNMPSCYCSSLIVMYII